MVVFTEYEQKIMENLKEKKKNGRVLGESSINLYMRNLQKINDEKPIRNLNFLTDIDDVKNKLGDYKKNTYRAFLIAIVSVLKVMKGENKKMCKLYEEYYKMMMDLNNELREQPMGQMSDTQKANWVSMDDIKSTLSQLEARVNNFKDEKEIGASQYTALLDYLILSLYILIQPRRNNDYQKMRIVRNPTPVNSDFNYLNLDENAFIFNNFKTAKSTGQQIKIIPSDLKSVIDIYLKFHPLFKDIRRNKVINVPFLVYYNGKEFDQNNSITRILNKLFAPKKVGSSMLRHIYLTDKYGDIIKEQIEDADAMAHSVNTARDIYVKFD